jgi:hypothetical protein
MAAPSTQHETSKPSGLAEDIVERLQAVSASANVLVIDHAEMPTSN